MGSKGCWWAPCLLQEQSDGVIKETSGQACLYPPGIRESHEVMSVGTLVNVKGLHDHLYGHRSPCCLPSMGSYPPWDSGELLFMPPYFSPSWARVDCPILLTQAGPTRDFPGLDMRPPGDRRPPVPVQEAEHLGLQAVTVPQVVGGWEGRGRALRTFFKSWIQLLPRLVPFSNFY